jgi:hypothetical protein
VLLTRLPLRIATALDLHVLGLPPAFALSQDQTLRLDEIFIPAGHSRFDEVRHTVRNPIARTAIEYVDLKRVPPKSRPAAPSREDAARKDSAVHVSLSSDSPVKQRGNVAFPTPDRRRAVEAPSIRPRSAAWSPYQ